MPLVVMQERDISGLTGYKVIILQMHIDNVPRPFSAIPGDDIGSGPFLAIVSRAGDGSDSAFKLAQGCGQLLDAVVEFLAGDGQRRGKAHDGFVRFLGQDALFL